MSGVILMVSHYFTIMLTVSSMFDRDFPVVFPLFEVFASILCSNFFGRLFRLCVAKNNGSTRRQTVCVPGKLSRAWHRLRAFPSFSRAHPYGENAEIKVDESIPALPPLKTHKLKTNLFTAHISVILIMHFQFNM